MKSFYGYNALGHTSALRPHIKRLQPRVLFYMDAWTEAAWAADTLPDTIIIHRVAKDEEDKMHRIPGRTLQHLQERVAERIHSRVYINLGTEPQVGEPDDLQNLVTEYLAAARWAVANRQRVALPHGAFYGISTVEQYKILEPLTTYIAENPEYLLFTVDEYFVGHAFSGVDQNNGQPNEAQTIQPDRWKASPIGVYWHMGRITNYFKWLVDNGYPLPKTVITEGGADALQDVESWRTSLIKTPGYDNIRGWRSLTSQWEAWYGRYGWSPERAFFEMLYAFWKEVYSRWDNIIGLCLFAWGSNGDATWNQFRLDDATEFQGLLEAANWTVSEEPEVTTVDVSKYILGDGRAYKLGGMGDETLRTRRVNGYGYQDKNEHWEQIWFDERFIYRGADTSPGGNQYYYLTEGNRYGSAWSPRYWTVGNTFKRVAQVTFNSKSTGATTVTYTDVTYLRFVKFHSSYTFKSGLTLNNVIELRAMRDRDGQPDENSFETYFYAENYGLVGWIGSGVGESYISQLNATVTKSPEVINFVFPLPPPTRPVVTYPEPDNPDMPVTISEVNVESTGTYSVRVRANAGTTAAIVGLIPAKGTPLPAREFEHLKTGLWRYFAFDDAGFEGYVSGDFITVTPRTPDTENPVVNIPTKEELEDMIQLLMTISDDLKSATDEMRAWLSKLL